MTAVLSATDPLRRDRMMDDINYSHSSTDWRAKYIEVADMLAETRGELEDFQHSSKELEEELERELERTEKAQQELKVKVARAENERDEWKSKFMALQTTHNTTTTSLQRELDTLRHEHQKVKVQLRDLEMGNDDLERNERAVASSLADMESKYSRALEEKILLEHELLDKANMEEECQRFRDEIRDANEEIAILKDQLAAANSRGSIMGTDITTPASSVAPSDEDLLRTAPPPDLQLADLLPSAEEARVSIDSGIARSSISSESSSRHSAFLSRAGFNPSKSTILAPHSSSPSSITRSTTLPPPGSRLTPRSTSLRPTFGTRTSSNTTTSTAGSATLTASRSKGVQMVSEMRARVKNLEQKIHTRVPRLRMGSVSGRNPLSPSASSHIVNHASPTPSTSTPLFLRSSTSRRSAESMENEKKRVASPVDSSGWVLIMEDSPTPIKNKDAEKDRNRNSSPSAPSAFRHASSNSGALESPTLAVASKGQHALSRSTMGSGIKRPASRVSTTTDCRSTSASTSATTSSIPTPSSRPSTPTFLPVPTSSLYHHAGAGLKRSTGPGAGPYSQAKRSSLGTSNNAKSPTDSTFSHRDRPTMMPPPPRPDSTASSSSGIASSNGHGTLNTEKTLPTFPHSNITIRSKIPASGSSSSVLSKSRIGRPSGGRKSAGSDTEGFLSVDKGRPRSGSTDGRRLS
ncbi:hypothetical protein JAAARDRAFT_29646 [Jaapia argillacea MUCL 33604]|uniref:NUDE domain-containing protein n=1 Tax=Jaapia argillacea MUCL 33604 TaxID=933084 RepID=A0A067QLV5_9AGAM|nr:hypothetical protein JAAARDRAFT_29646 [Jaapia argillacea MUCL 33604]